MDENSAIIESILREDQEEAERHRRNNRNDDTHGWQTVSYQKRHRKSLKHPDRDAPTDIRNRRSNGAINGDVFRSVELQSEERRRRIQEADMAASVPLESSGGGSKRHSDDDDDDDGSDAEGSAVQNDSGVEKKKAKPKKPKKPKMTVAEAASKIDSADLEAFLADITAKYESQQDIQLMRFADYFGQAFSAVSAAQFPWLKIFKESSVSKLVDIPLSHISEPVYKTSVDWISKRSIEALGSFVLWSLDSIFSDLASHQGTAKPSKKVIQQAPSKSQVAIFMVLAMALRRKPDILMSLLPVMKESPKYQGQDKLPVNVWLIAQVSQGDLAVGLYMWSHLLLPMLSSKSTCNPQSRDLILQLVEKILSSPKARPILINGAVRKGERLVAPSALDLLMRYTFPTPSARVKATERFEAVYPTLKEIALAGSPGSKAMKQAAQQIFDFVTKALKEDIPDLSKEATNIFIWCLMQSPECYKQWDMIYMDDLETSVVILRKLSDEWKELSAKHLALGSLRETLKSFRLKNDLALAKEDDGTRLKLLKDANKYCKSILGRLSQSNGCMKSIFLVTIVMAVGAGIMLQNVESWDLKSISEMFVFP